MGPWLSILMPTYQGERYLPATLASLREQPLEGVELLVVDDGSTDRTVALARAFGAHAEVRVLEGPRRGSWTASTNLALAEARGELACLLHQDDGYLPGRLRAVRELRARFPAAALWTHGARFVDPHGRDLGPWSPSLPAAPLVDGQEVLARLLVQNTFAIPCPTFRAEDARRVGGLEEGLWYAADWDLWLKLAALGPTAWLDTPLAFFRVHGESQTVRRSGDAAAFRAQLTTVLERHLPRLAGDAGTARAVARAARLSLELNVALASALHGGRPALRPLLGALGPALGPGPLRRLLRDGRLEQRVGARLRARLGQRAAAGG